MGPLLLLFLLLPVFSDSLRLCAPSPNADKSTWFLSKEEKCPISDLIDVKFVDNIQGNGWAFVDVKVLDGRMPVEEQGYWAGFLEGSASRRLIGCYKANMIDDFCNGAEEFCEKLYDFLEKNYRWTMKMMDGSRYWEKVSLVMSQVKGMIDGFEGVKYLPMNPRQIVTHPVYLMQLFGDLEDLKEKFNYPEKEIVPKGRSHCSALVKILPYQSDILFSHVTWTSYASMTRVQKKYSFALSESGREMAFSGYPGVVTSIDDFVVTSARLAVLETTITNHNESLWQAIKPESLLYFVRSQVAHLMANSGKEWSKMFSQYNSGTYNNQWMIVDYKIFKKGRESQKPGLFTLLEQMPGLVVVDDLTEKLMEKGFWPGYNRAYFQKISEISEVKKMVEKYGNWYSYEKAPRALIFARDQHTVVDLQSMMRLMRSNNYTQDPLSRCECTPPYSAESAISARSELNSPNGRYPIKDLGFMDQGATDAKITNSTMVQKLQFMAVAGPPGHNKEIPEFSWRNSILKDTVPHKCQPEDFSRFSPIIHEWEDRINETQ